MLSSIFGVTDLVVVDNGILRFEYHRYELEAGTKRNTTVEIRMHVIS